MTNYLSAAVLAETATGFGLVKLSASSRKD
jgi:hypothetical protein